MLYTLSIPLVDYRSLLNEDTHRLDINQFPRSWNDNSFLRNFGRFGVRVNPGNDIPYSEKKYARANNGLRIEHQNRILRGGTDIVPSYVFRRVFFDTYSARFDIGIKNVSSDVRMRDHSIKTDDINNTILALLETKVYSTRFTKSGSVSLRKIGEDLALEYIYATTKNPIENIDRNSKNNISVGLPSVIVELHEKEIINYSIIETKGFKRFRHIPPEWGIALGYRTITRENIPVFVLIRNKNSNKEKLRALRINLLKYHQERVTLEAVMRLVARKSQDELHELNTGVLGNYLDTVTSVYSRNSRAGIEQGTILGIMRNVEKVVNHNECAEVLRILLTNDRLFFLSKRFEKTIELLYSAKFESGELVTVSEYVKTIFLSYKSEDEPIADLIKSRLEDRLGSRIRISKYTDLNYKSSFREFMDSIEEHDYVICIVSDKYLKSPACMYEVGEVIKSKQFAKRLMHIILRTEDVQYYKKRDELIVANVFTSESRLKYTQYWKDAYRSLKADIDAIDDIEATSAETQTLREYDRIYKDIGGFLSYISRHDAKTLKRHVSNNFDDIVSAMGL